jgi:hypothetical protein
VVALKVPKNSGYQAGVYDTSEPQHTALITPGKQSTKMRAGYHDLLLVSGEAHDQVSFGGVLVDPELLSRH